MEIKIKKQNEEIIKFCPHCGSTELKSLVWLALSPKFDCISCGYQGTVFEGTKDFIETFKRKLAKKNKA